MKIFLDAGHGGKDSGAVGNGLKEKDLTLTIVKKIGAMLGEYEGVEVLYSRTDDRFLELSERAALANNAKADYFNSIHINATPSGTGYESFIHTNASSQSVAYQNVIHAEVLKAIGKVKDRGKKRANHAVTRLSHMPAILTENLFIDNAVDGALLKQDSFLDLIAKGHVNGYVKAFGLKQKAVQSFATSNQHSFFFTGGYAGQELARVHQFLLENGYGYSPIRNDQGYLMFDVGGFPGGSEAAEKMENFLKQNHFAYEKRIV
jgi:N-acetylmuramoyl-L-alanine amidase